MQGTLEDADPDRFEDFVKALPFPTMARPDGIENIAAYRLRNKGANHPDLGPKLHAGPGCSESGSTYGVTSLHMDMANAVNLMTWSSTPDAASGKPGMAVWDVYHATHSQAIRSYLREKHNLEATYDPIHAQEFYLDAQCRRELFQKHGVRSWRIYQRPGDAVFVPAGCAHQVGLLSRAEISSHVKSFKVCNLAACIKVAVGFVTVESLGTCAAVTEEFRRINLDHTDERPWKADVLGLEKMMFQAWQSLRGRRCL